MNRVVVLSALALASLPSPALAGAPAVPAPTSAHGQAFEPQGTGANYSILEVGAQAPDFAFESQGRDLRLHDLRAQGHVLLVIEPDDAGLRAARARTRAPGRARRRAGGGHGHGLQRV